MLPLGQDLSSDLVDLDDDEFRRLERRKSDHNVGDAEVDVVLHPSLLVAFDEVGVLRRCPLE